MAFMTPYYTEDTFWRVERANGESELFPDGFDALRFAQEPDNKVTSIEPETGWWCRRLSADGYMDCTDWSGPFATREEAQEHIKEQYDVAPDTGDDLPEGEGE